MKLTAKIVDGLELPATKAAHTWWDSEAVGLGYRIQGARCTWVVRFVAFGTGKRRQITLGSADTISLKRARGLAGEYLVAARQGRDLDQEHRQAAETTRRQQEASKTGKLSVLVEKYLADAERRFRPKSLYQERIYLLKHWSRFHDRQTAELTRREIVGELEAMVSERGPVSANRARSALSRLFRFGVERGYLDHSPSAGIRPVAKEQSRSRVLSLEELATVWKGSLDLGEGGVIIRLLMLTGSRRAEVGGLVWGEIDLERGVWTLPASRSKNQHEQITVLPRQALEEIEAVGRKPDRACLFGGRRGLGFGAWTRLRDRIDQACPGLEHWTLHDLRRSMAKHLSERGVDVLTVELLLNHRSGGVRGTVGAIYNRSQRLEARAKALQLWANLIEAEVKGQPATSNIVAMSASSA